MIDHTFAYSTNIRRVQHDGTDLYITFKQGRRYKFKGVPETVAQAAIDAPSVGKYYYDHIQGKYEYEECK